MDRRPTRSRPVTVADVARAAQVSKATAARALGSYGAVSAEVRQRVLAAARQLDYRANELARTMATGRSGTLGVVVGDIENPFFGLAVRGISDAGKAAGYDVILSNSAEDVAEEQAAVEVLTAKGVDGLIVAPCERHAGAHLAALLGRGRPLVLLDREVAGLEVDAALVDGRAAAMAATRLLIEAGHRRIAYVTATAAPDWHFTAPAHIKLTTVLSRIEGFLEVAVAAGLTEADRQIGLGATDTRQAQRILAEILTASRRPTAILASDSKIALEVLRAAKALRLAIPRELSLVAFDDADWTSAVDPAVTVVAQPTYQLGVTAARMLIERIAGEHGPPRRRVLPAELIERESVAAPGGIGQPRRGDG